MVSQDSGKVMASKMGEWSTKPNFAEPVRQATRERVFRITGFNNYVRGLVNANNFSDTMLKGVRN